MRTLTSAGDVTGLTLLAAAVVAAIVRTNAWRRLRPRWLARRPALRLVHQHTIVATSATVQADKAVPAPAQGRPRLVLVEDRVSGPAALELEEAVGPRD
jgi:hypothetical protein